MARHRINFGVQLQHHFRPRGAARKAFESRKSEVLLSGPAGTGKSRGLLEKMHVAAMKYPGMRGLIVRKTQVSLSATGLVTFREKVIAEALAAKVCTFYGGSPEQPPQYRYRNGSRIMIGGLDKASKIMSSEYDMIFVQEATELTEGDWDALTTRLRNGVMPYQQLLADCNPDAPHHWLYLRGQRGTTEVMESRHEDNPLLFDDSGTVTEFGKDYIAKLDNLTGVRKERLRFGRWVAAEGIIYDEYDPAVHLVDRFEIPKSWTRYWVVDFGYTNPFVCQFWAIDDDGRAFMYREIYYTKRTVDIHARDILAQVRKPAEHVARGKRIPDPTVPSDWEWLEPKPRTIITDHDAGDRAILERELGFSTTAAHKSVPEGIQSVKARLVKAGDGKPRLFILRDSVVERDPDLVDARKPTSTAEEIVSYIWAPGPDGKPLKEEPLKRDDHGMDAMRYLVADLDLGARPRVRIMGARPARRSQ